MVISLSNQKINILINQLINKMRTFNKFLNRYFKKNKKITKQEEKFVQQQQQSQKIIAMSSDVSENERASSDTNSSADEIELLVSFELQSHDQLFNQTQKDVSHYSKTEITLDHSTLLQMYMDKDPFTSQITTMNTNSLLESSASSSSGFSEIETNINTSRNSLPSDSSLQRIDETIRFKFFTLKRLANSDTSTQNPVSISMLEALYELKLIKLNQESADILKKFDKDSNKRFFNILSSKIKGFRQRSKSVDKNANRCKVERSLLECKMESKIRLMQWGVLASIKDLEIQFKHLHRQSNPMNKRSNYSTEIAMKKRIRNRQRRHSCNHSRSRCNSADDSRRSSICVDFESSVTVPRYKNDHAEETMV